MHPAAGVEQPRAGGAATRRGRRRGSGPARWVWPKTTCAASTSSRATTSPNARSAGAPQLGPATRRPAAARARPVQRPPPAPGTPAISARRRAAPGGGVRLALAARQRAPRLRRGAVRAAAERADRRAGRSRGSRRRSAPAQPRSPRRVEVRPSGSRTTAPSRRRRAARASAPSCADRSSGRASRTRRRAARRPGRPPARVAGASRRGDRRQHLARAPVDRRFEPERRRRARGARAARASRHQLVVVVARHDHDLAALAERGADRPQHRLGRRERIARRPVTELDHVAEQHQAIDAVERREQRARGPSRAQHIAARCARRGAGRRRPACARPLPVQVGGVARQRLADRLGEHEADVLLDDLELLHVARARDPEELDQPLYELVGGAGARRDADDRLADEPLARCTCDSLSIRYESAPCSRATSTRRLEFDEFREPITSTRSHSRASCLTAACRLVVA